MARKRLAKKGDSVPRWGGWDYLAWGFFVLGAWMTAVFLAWYLLAKVDFLYPLWYEVLDIEQTVATYGPRHRYRPHFQLTTKAERVRLFAAIVTAVHNQAEGLADLRYHNPAGRAIGLLLTEPEIVHLQDVARLIDRLKPPGWAMVLVTLVLAGLFRVRKKPMPPLGRLMLGAVAGLGSVVLLVLLLGPVNVFYRLHEWIFPAGHAWFFYYEDSLMTLLMQAPNLFGFIALSLVLVSFLLLLALLVLTAKVLGR